MTDLRRRTVLSMGAGLAASALSALPARAKPRKSFKIAWSVYTGYMPWPYAEKSGILKKWADKYKIKIDVVQVNDYIESLNQFTTGDIDAVATTTMDALTIPAAGGVDTTVLLLGDYSDGNDGITLKGSGKHLADVKGKTLGIVQFSVSHFMLARALQKAGLSEADLKLQNISDADFVTAFKTGNADGVVSWNPGFSEIRALPDTSTVFDSKEIPGELVDVTITKTKVLAENPDFGKALAGAWFEALATMKGTSPAAKQAIAMMAEMSGTSAEFFLKQVGTTHFYADPVEGAAVARSAELMGGMDLVRSFCFEHKLMGDKVTSKDAIGIAFPGGRMLGDPRNVKLRFEDRFMQAAADKTI